METTTPKTGAKFGTPATRRCPEQSGALFLYRKMEAALQPVLLAAPALHASEEQVEEWLASYNAAIEDVDSEAAAQKAAAEKAATPAEGGAAEPAGGGRSFPCSCLTSRQPLYLALVVTWRRACCLLSPGAVKGCLHVQVHLLAHR